MDYLVYLLVFVAGALSSILVDRVAVLLRIRKAQQIRTQRTQWELRLESEGWTRPRGMSL